MITTSVLHTRPPDALVPLDQEQEVVRRLKGGEAQALGVLYQWYGQRVFHLAIRHLGAPDRAEDVLKETFRAALEKIHQFQSEDRSIWFWIRRIAINRCLDIHRADQRRRKMEDRVKAEPELSVVGAQPVAPDRALDRDETREMIALSLSQLNPRYAEALTLRLLQDLDREECAERMGVTVGNFDVILHRACKAFREKYPPT